MFTKKRLFYMLILATTFLITTCLSPVNAPAASIQVTVENTKPNDDLPTVTIEEYKQNISRVIPVSASRYLSLVKNSNSPLILYIGYKECPYCRAFSQVFKNFLDGSSIPI